MQNEDPYGIPSTTKVGMREPRPPAPVKLSALVARGVAGESLDSKSVTRICVALLETDRRLRAERLGAKLLEDALRATRAEVGPLKRQLEGKIQEFTLRELNVDEFVEEPTKKGQPRPMFAVTCKRAQP